MKTYCQTTSRCLPGYEQGSGELVPHGRGVFSRRSCPIHGPVEGLTCFDVRWYESLTVFDLPPVHPAYPNAPSAAGGLVTAVSGPAS